jgi:hypothetical protein
MREIIIPFSSTVTDEADRTIYRARAIGRERPGGIWEGFIEFESDSGERLVTDVETTQPNRTDLEYWITGIEPIYLDGALERAKERA